jgi:hypothetical protein
MLHFSLYFVAYLVVYALVATFFGGVGVLLAMFCGAKKSHTFRMSVIVALAGVLFSIYIASMTPVNNEYVFVQLTACLLLLAIVLCLPWRRSPLRLLLARAEGRHRL